ncbi:transposase, partial [Lacticaseibacillus paracasei]
GCDVRIRTKIENFGDIAQVRIVPRKYHYVVEVVYNKEAVVFKEDVGIIASIDLGLKNLATVALSDLKNPFIINGNPLKSINQYYNKAKARQQNKLIGGLKTSKSIKKLTH